jgi:hypothetical protein
VLVHEGVMVALEAIVVAHEGVVVALVNSGCFQGSISGS